LIPAADSTTSIATAFATGRFARTCTAIASGDTGGLATTTFCAETVGGKTLLIIVALARMRSFVEELMRERRAIPLRPLPQGDEPRNAGTIVVLLIVKGYTTKYLYACRCAHMGVFGVHLVT
jgi:hypothetical protein